MSAPGRVHVIGAGLAGLSAAVRLSHAGVPVTIHETAKHAGGRCRSFYDDALEATIDNGSHLLLSGNREVLDFLDLTGGRGELVQAPRAAFDFFDLSSGARWCLDMGRGRGKGAVLKWMFSKRRQHPPGFTPTRFLKDVFALRKGRGQSVAACVDPATQLYRNLWRPLSLAVVNAEPDEAAAEMIWAVLAQTVLKGGSFAKPLFAPNGLGAALVDPALAVLKEQGVELHFQRRITALDVVQQDGRARIGDISFAHAAEVLGAHDAVILAVPHHGVGDLVAGLQAPTDSRAILNVHYRVGTSVDTPRMLGLVGGEAEWLFQRGPIVSVTISGAAAWMDKDTDAIAHALWPEVACALDQESGEAGKSPPYRVIKERRATFAATPDALANRSGTRTGIGNLYLAGDWTDTGLPATLEGAVKSGRLAAEAAMADLD